MLYKTYDNQCNNESITTTIHSTIHESIMLLRQINEAMGVGVRDQKGYIDNPNPLKTTCAHQGCIIYLCIAHNMDVQYLCDQAACCLICMTQRTNKTFQIQ